MASLFFCLRIDIVACHLLRGSKLRWHEDIGEELPNASNLLGCKEYAQQDLFNLYLKQTGWGLPQIQLFVTSVCEILKRLFSFQNNIVVGGVGDP